MSCMTVQHIDQISGKAIFVAVENFSNLGTTAQYKLVLKFQYIISILILSISILS